MGDSYKVFWISMLCCIPFAVARTFTLYPKLKVTSIHTKLGWGNSGENTHLEFPDEDNKKEAVIENTEDTSLSSFIRNAVLTPTTGLMNLWWLLSHLRVQTFVAQYQSFLRFK